MTPEQLAEYNQMRQEILIRMNMHHQHLVYAVVLQFVSLVFLVWMNHLVGDWASTQIFLLALPVVFAGLTFNYQANQATMESVAVYLNQQYGEVGMKWEEFFAGRKSKQKLISFSKALPIVWPQFIPVALLFTVGWPEGSLESSLMIVDLILLVVVLLNFRFKATRIFKI